MRGERLFNQLNSTTQSLPESQSKKGRNDALFKKRNEQLAYRYYYYSRIHRKTYADVMTQLEREFCIAAATISFLVTGSIRDKVKEIYEKAPSIGYLAKTFPHFSWNSPNK